MTRTLLALLALALFGSARADDPDPRSLPDVFGKPRAHGPLVEKAFLGLYSGRTDLYFGQPIVVELFGIPATKEGPYVRPFRYNAKLTLTDAQGIAVPFELEERGYGGSSSGEVSYFRFLPTKAHSVGGFWKPGTYTLRATVTNAPNPTNPVTLAGAFTSNELKFVIRAADAPRDELDPKRQLALSNARFGGGPSDHFWLHAAGLSAKAQDAERERLKLSAESWAVHVARLGPVTVPQDRALTAAEEKQLIADLSAEAPGVRARAARSVPRGASKEVFAALLPRLGDSFVERIGGRVQVAEFPVRDIAAETLVRLGAEVVPALVAAGRGELYAEHRGDVAYILGRIGHHPDAEKWLAELFDGKPDDVQYEAINAVKKWGAAGNELSRRAVARLALPFLVRREAIQALGNSGTLKEDAARLRPFLAAKEDDLQCAAVRALLTLKDAESLPAFERIARDAKIDQNTRYPAVDAVLALAPKETGDKLLLDIIARPDDRLRGFALQRAGQRTISAALPLALDALDDKDWYNRVMADYALRGLANDPAGVGYDPAKPDAKAWRAFWAKREKN